MDEQFGSNDNADLAFIVFDVKGKMKGMNESYDLVLTTSEAAGSTVKVTLTGAVFADSSEYAQNVKFPVDAQTVTVKVIALGTAVTVKGE